MSPCSSLMVQPQAVSYCAAALVELNIVRAHFTLPTARCGALTAGVRSVALTACSMQVCNQLQPVRCSLLTWSRSGTFGTQNACFEARTNTTALRVLARRNGTRPYAKRSVSRDQEHLRNLAQAHSPRPDFWRGILDSWHRAVCVLPSAANVASMIDEADTPNSRPGVR